MWRGGMAPVVSSWLGLEGGSLLVVVCQTQAVGNTRMERNSRASRERLCRDSSETRISRPWGTWQRLALSFRRDPVLWGPGFYQWTLRASVPEAEDARCTQSAVDAADESVPAPTVRWLEGVFPPILDIADSGYRRFYAGMTGLPEAPNRVLGRRRQPAGRCVWTRARQGVGRELLVTKGAARRDGVEASSFPRHQGSAEAATQHTPTWARGSRRGQCSGKRVQYAQGMPGSFLRRAYSVASSLDALKSPAPDVSPSGGSPIVGFLQPPPLSRKSQHHRPSAALAKVLHLRSTTRRTPFMQLAVPTPQALAARPAPSAPPSRILASTHDRDRPVCLFGS
ncbi:hypothetical protein Micbo1qcDRAFT_196010 [Microdochium bolleyi]|uniref:Ig-like domain-containing protein n=1 Tax=Microdochium bolleyi TaxID=196109 RepID=A0A136IZX2_9PEZI|nr:hypothetical protein Micbo1qcDRAFT_196010 [Microdochium bolleyi]